MIAIIFLSLAIWNDFYPELKFTTILMNKFKRKKNVCEVF